MTHPALLTILGVEGWGPVHLGLPHRGEPAALRSRLAQAWRQARQASGCALSGAHLLAGLLRSQSDLLPLAVPWGWDLPDHPRFRHRLVCGRGRLRLRSWELLPGTGRWHPCGEEPHPAAPPPVAALSTVPERERSHPEGAAPDPDTGLVSSGRQGRAALAPAFVQSFPDVRADPPGMGPTLQHQAIAPRLLLRGPGAWREALGPLGSLCQRPLLVGRSAATASLRHSLASDLQAAGLEVRIARMEQDCCEQDLARLATAACEPPACDGIIAVGGGKVLDAGKLLADRLGRICITVPTSAATCAGWTALANIYSPQGAFQGDVPLSRCPDLLVFDHELVRGAPRRTLASGIADAMAKWYEAAVSSGDSGDPLVQMAVQMARVLRDQLLLEAEQALADPCGEAWGRVAEAVALTAGLIGGLGGAACRTVAAHAVHNGLTQLPASHGHLHGEKVGYGILVQLRLEEQLAGNRLACQARRQLLSFFRRLGLPLDLGDLGLAGASVAELRQACAFACRPGSDLHRLPFAVGEADLLAALVSTTAELRLP